MLMESTTIQILHVVLLTLTPRERWSAAGQEFNAYSAVEGWLTGFAMAALIISLILVFYLSANHKRSLDDFRQKIAGLKGHIDELQQRISELDQQAPAKASGQKLPEESEELVAVQKS
jgi:uncharacterized membrane protein (DUF106 family)